jgi:hypothetical protein
MELHRVTEEHHCDAFHILPRQAMNQWCLTPVCSWPVRDPTHLKAIKLEGELEYRTNIVRVLGAQMTGAANVKVEVTLNQARKKYGEAEIWLHELLTSTLGEGERSASWPECFLLEKYLPRTFS